jgi:hypothetical protein
VIITLGFTQSDRASDYSSFLDGYHLGARQTCVSIAVDSHGIDLPPEQWAEAAFIATNQPALHLATTPAFDRAVTAIREALTTQTRPALRCLSVGDTVTLTATVLACDPAGWRPITGPTPPEQTSRPAPQP